MFRGRFKNAVSDAALGTLCVFPHVREEEAREKKNAKIKKHSGKTFGCQVTGLQQRLVTVSYEVRVVQELTSLIWFQDDVRAGWRGVGVVAKVRELSPPVLVCLKQPTVT